MGGISTLGMTTLHTIRGTLNSQKYQELLKNHKKEIKKMFGRKKWFFQQDGATCHRAKKSVRYIEENLTRHIIPHPAQSPDFNPIELVWAQMKRLVQAKKPKTQRELETAVFQTWDKLKIKFIRDCIKNLKKKLQKAIDKDGVLL